MPKTLLKLQWTTYCQVAKHCEHSFYTKDLDKPPLQNLTALKSHHAGT